MAKKDEMFEKMHRQNKDHEYRRVMQVRAMQPDGEDTNKMFIEGKAVAFEEETVLFKYDGIDYKEIISNKAFESTDMSYAFLKYNHSDSIMAMARTKNETLDIEVKDDGVYIKAELANTTAGRDLFELVRRGDIDKMSFSFHIEEESYNENEHTWTVHKIDRLYDVAAVTIPAYENTDLYARRYGEVETERINKVEALEAERSRKEILVRLNILN